MIQVKIFEAPLAEELEAEMNTWFKDNATIDIVSVTQSESAIADEEGDLCGNVTVSVIYKN